MLPFHEHIITDLLSDSNGGGGGLVILSSGLALHKLISSLLLLHTSSSGTLLLLSATPSQKISITQSLLSLNPNPNPNSLPSEITFDLSVQHRHSLYSSSSIFFITSRILIVDLLTSKIPISKISGLIILNAHNLTDTCTESFIVRIFRGLNKEGYVRAFSDKPVSMVSGFAKAERIMKSLYLKKLYFWPRFQVYVSQDLEKDPPVVVDIRVEMSVNMKGIQKAVIEAMDACLKEIRKTNKVDVEDLTVENGLFKSFDEIIRRQLDPIWHTLGKKTKQLVTDLRTLRKLLDYLVSCVESSYKIFEFAKKRVYRLVRSDDEKLGVDKGSAASKKRKTKEDQKEKEGTSTTSGAALEVVLEEAPKWKVLREVLEEIEEERQKQDLMGREHAEGVEDDSFMVLVACKDERSCMQLEDCIKKGPQQTMQEAWEKYLLNKVELQAIQAHHNKKKSKDPKGFGILNGAIPIRQRENADISSFNKFERDALLAAASEISKVLSNESEAKDNPQPPASNEGSGKEKGKGKGKGLGQKKKGPANVKNSKKPSETSGSDSKVNDTRPVGPQIVNAKPIPQVHFYALESHQDILDIVKPSIVIVYHPDMTFVREVEIYKAENPSRLLKVYFLFYEDSTEVQKFEASIRRENGAFESLIRQKSHMMIPANQDEPCSGPGTSNGPDALNVQNSLTRKAGGRKQLDKEMQVIVDMREFMSSLPNVLHMKGMKIIPVTLEVGDYILSPLICVERKSIMDLYQSFASGRLYHQVEMMSRYYQIPVLLIEFLQDKSFSFQSASDIGDDVTPTTEIFATLKANQDEPDETKAMRVGVPSDEGIIEDDVRSENYNTSAVEFLRRLPGVTDANYRTLMDGCGSLAELAILPVERLAELMGSQKSAKTLRDFLDAKFPTMS
ncbi:DNA repair endonuclease uvh1 [Ranunculus cassubicifolius]